MEKERKKNVLTSVENGENEKKIKENLILLLYPDLSSSSSGSSNSSFYIYTEGIKKKLHVSEHNQNYPSRHHLQEKQHLKIIVAKRGTNYFDLND